MTNSTVRRVIVLGTFSILSLIAVQTYWVLRAWDLQEREFNRKVNQALMDAANDLAHLGQFMLRADSLIYQVYSNYYVVNVENQFDAPTLEFYLQRAFENQGLKEDFQYGIFDCSSKQMITGRTVRYQPASPLGGNGQLSDPLPPHYDSDFIYYFGVRFPNKSANLLSNMWLVVGFTALMFITVVFFVYAMFVILRQKKLSELQRDFINNMTHEFKTPISTINISTDVFLKSEKIQSDPRLNRYSNIIKEQVLRLNNQVEKVLQLAKIDRNNIELNLEVIDLAELVRSISPSLEIKIQEKNGRFQLDVPATHTGVRADRLHLTNIVHNLVDNAVKYSRAEPHIRIVLSNERHDLIMAIQDNGIGIPREYQKRVFDKFYRVPTGNVHNVKGFGLGLFYVKKMVREHRWRLDLVSDLGKGTTISVRMPWVNPGKKAGRERSAAPEPEIKEAT